MKVDPARSARGKSARRRGIDLERRVRDDLADKGYQVVRPAGSKGAADLWAMKRGRILGVQVKMRGYMPPAERLDLEVATTRAGATPVLADRIRDPHDGRRTRIRYRTPTGKEDVQV